MVNSSPTSKSSVKPSSRGLNINAMVHIPHQNLIKLALHYLRGLRVLIDGPWPFAIR